MLITKDFVCLNNPKTGSTYARKVLKELYPKRLSSVEILLSLKNSGSWYIELKKTNLQFPNRPKNQHGTYSQIPNKYRNRAILSVARNPYDKFVSAWEYKYWLKQRPSSEILQKLKIDKLEEISLDDFIRIQVADTGKRFGHLKELEIGSQTIQFIYMFFKDPEKVMMNLSEDYFKEKQYLKDMPQITILDQANLTSDLFDYLKQFNPDPNRIEKARSISNINVNNKRKSVKDFSWTENALEYVAHYERYLFQILNDFDLNYQKPALEK